MDNPDIPEQDLYKNYKELNWVNRFLGGYKASFYGIRQAQEIADIESVIDIGSGGGDTLAKISIHFRLKDCKGVDYSKAAINYARTKYPEIAFECAPYQKSEIPKTNAAIHTALFNHHLSPKENIAFLKWAKSNSTVLIINDLQRSFWAWIGIYLIQLWSSFSYLFKNDAPLSVKRAHSLSEWKEMLEAAGYVNYSITKKPMFRYVIVASV